MRFSALPPVRRPVPLTRGNSQARLAMERFFGNRKITLYASGTAALAQAIADCALHASVRSPEVILPAYGCPDLIAACVHASVYPRLIDVEPSSWSYDPDSLKSAITGNTVAIVAVNLLGVGDCADELTHLSRERRIRLIQDSAQHLPREPVDWSGDYVILSFGRGKPLNLLHGGALIQPPGRSPHAQPGHYPAGSRLLASRTAAIAFNAITRPSAYRLCSLLPGTGLGEVAYKPLTHAKPLPECAWRQVGIAFDAYRQKPSYRRDIWAAALQEWSRLGISLLECPGTPSPAEPLRLPLLAPDRPARDIIVKNLNHNGLGASGLYATDLTAVAGAPAMVRHQGPFPHARELAGRLFTLPTHSQVQSDTVESAHDVMLAWHRSRLRPHG